MGARPLKGHCQKLGAKRKREVLLGFSPPLMMQSPNSIQGGRSSPECPGHRRMGTISLEADLYPESRVEGSEAHPRAQRQRTCPGNHIITPLSLEMSWFGRSCWFAGSTPWETDSSLAVTLIADVFHFLP